MLLDTTTVAAGVASGWSSDAVQFIVAAEDLADASAMSLSADDDGTGTGLLNECAETKNDAWWDGPFCD